MGNPRRLYVHRCCLPFPKVCQRLTLPKTKHRDQTRTLLDGNPYKSLMPGTERHSVSLTADVFNQLSLTSRTQNHAPRSL